MTTRPFSVVRRRANLVDVLIPKNAATEIYRLQTAANFDAAYGTLVEGRISQGYLGPTINRAVLTTLPSHDHVRIVFDPDEEGLTDTEPFWMRFVPVDFAGGAGTPSVGMLIHPEEAHQGDGRTVIRGNAPSAGSIAGSLEIGLPRRFQGLTITNNDGADELLVSFTEGGYEYQILATESQSFLEGAHERLFVRGDGAVVNFSASFTSYLPL